MGPLVRYREHGDPLSERHPFRLEGTIIKRFKSEFGIGVIGSWIQQLNDDGGAMADSLNGFVGHAFGVGPILTYTTKLGKKSNLDFNARWVHEFENHNRPEGDLFQFSGTLKSDSKPAPHERIVIARR